jgi:hypothetical protein
LLGNGRPAAHLVDIVGLGNGFADFGEVESMVAAEASILGDDDDKRQRRRDARDRQKLTLDPQSAQPSRQHDRRDRIHDRVKRRDQIGQ